jgi:methanogenic corrinoid protein MtbC1/DNA-binding XRE family transcriptional regulator
MLNAVAAQKDGGRRAGREVDSSVTKLREQYMAVAMSGDQVGAGTIVDQALALGVTPKNVYIHLLMPAQQEIGERWHAGEVTISQEHAATQITFSEMGRLRPMLRRKQPIGKRIVISSVQGDPHLIGGRMVADFLHMDGWDVDFLGADTPTPELVRFVKERKPAVVGLSVTLGQSVNEARNAATEIRKVLPGVKVVVGGFLVASDAKLAETIKADAYVARVQDADNVARILIGLPKSTSSLPELLKAVGNRISTARKAQRFSQQEIADVSGLERAYISAVEHGKHNLTLGAVMRLANALDVSIEELIVGNE